MSMNTEKLLKHVAAQTGHGTKMATICLLVQIGEANPSYERLRDAIVSVRKGDNLEALAAEIDSATEGR